MADLLPEDAQACSNCHWVVLDAGDRCEACTVDVVGNRSGWAPASVLADVPCDHPCDLATEAARAIVAKPEPEPGQVMCPMTNLDKPCIRDRCQMWGGTFTTEGIWVSDCRLVHRSWVREV